MRVILVILGAWWLELITVPTPPSTIVVTNEQSEECNWLGVCDDGRTAKGE